MLLFLELFYVISLQSFLVYTSPYLCKIRLFRRIQSRDKLIKSSEIMKVHVQSKNSISVSPFCHISFR